MSTRRYRIMLALLVWAMIGFAILAVIASPIWGVLAVMLAVGLARTYRRTGLGR